MQKYHILNGDALKERFPLSIKGQLIVARLCLVDGEVKANSLESLFELRANFIEKHYEGFKREDYFDYSVPEIMKIKKLPDSSPVYLWFEEDLFCQVNFWFVSHLISIAQSSPHVYLVLPKKSSAYSFAGMDDFELQSAQENAIDLDKRTLHSLSELWTAYQKNDDSSLIQIAKSLKEKLPFLIPAVKAQIDRFPKDGQLGRPQKALMNIMQETGATSFGPVFKSFCAKEPIYGFGDLQVYRLYKEILGR